MRTLAPRLSAVSRSLIHRVAAGKCFPVETIRRRGRGPEVRSSRLPAAPLPRVPAHLSLVAPSPWWSCACAVPIAPRLWAAA